MRLTRPWLGVCLVSIVFAGAFWLWLPGHSRTPASNTLTSRLLELYEPPFRSRGLLSPGPLLSAFEEVSSPALGFGGGAEALAFEARLESGVRGPTSADDLYGLGLLRILQERFDEGIELLEAASLQDPDRAEILTDLALARLEKALRDERPQDLLDGLEAALRARALAPESAAVHLNLGLLLDEVGLDKRAAYSFERFIEADPASETAAWASRRFRELEEANHQHWPAARQEIERLLSRAEVKSAEALVERHSSEARIDVLEVALRLWAEGATSGDAAQADRALELSALVGSVSARQDGDLLIADGFAVLREAESSVSELATLIQGHRSLGEGIELRQHGDCDRAEGFLTVAIARLNDAESPLAHLGRFNSLICLYYQDAPDALRLLAELRSEVASRPYPALLGRIDWMLGRAAAASGDFWTASRHYRAALDTFLDSNDRLGAAGICALLAEAYRHLGETDRSWEVRRRGLRAAADLGNPEELDRLLEEAVLALLDEGRLELALLFQDEQRIHAHRVRARELSMASLLTLRAQVERQLGRPGLGLANLEEARRVVAAKPADATRRRLEADLRLEEALSLVATEPSRALAAFSEVLSSYADIDYRARLPELLHGRALAHLGLGNTEAAGIDLRDALSRIELRRQDPTAEETRIAQFERAQPVFDSAIRFHLETARDPAQALAVADRARSRAFLDRLGQSAGWPAGTEDLAAGLRRSLPARTALVEYAVLPESLAIWIVEREGVEAVLQPIARDDLARRSELLRRVLEGHAPESLLDGLTTDLFEDLLRPVVDRVAAGTALVLVPDRFLVGLPFRGLRDGRTGEYLIERHPVAIAPSALLLAAQSSRPPSSRDGAKALLVGNPAFDRDRYPDLAPLPGAEQEALQAAALYPGAEVLTGDRATGRAFSAALRGKQFLHLAAHATADPRIGSRLILAPGPDIGAPGALELRSLDPEVLAALELAFISTCESARPFTDGAREGLAGPARDLLGAGVPAVVGTLWRIDDRTSADLAVRFHLRFRDGEEPMAALRAAQLDLLAHEDARLRSPSAWAGFELFIGAWPSNL